MLAEIDKEELLKVFTGEKRKDEDDTTLKPSTKKVMTQPALQKLFLAVCFFTLVHVFQQLKKKKPTYCKYCFLIQSRIDDELVDSILDDDDDEITVVKDIAHELSL